MKKILLTVLVSVFILLGAKAQTGIYMTYNDFKSGNLLKADTKSLSIKTMKHMVSIKVNGELKEFETKDIFGLLINGSLFRFSTGSVGNLSCKLVGVTDDYYVWYFTDTYTNASPNVGAAHRQTKEVVYYISKGINGEMYDVTMNGRLDKLAELKEFKPLVDCVKSGKKLTMMHNLMVAIGECMTKDPTYKKVPEDVIPPVK